MHRTEFNSDARLANGVYVRRRRANKGSRTCDSVIQCIAHDATCIFNEQRPEERTSMAKQEAFGARLDLKQFFEASVGALQNMNGSGEVANRAIRHHRAPVERTRVDVTQTNRALADAARALTALWKT